MYSYLHDEFEALGVYHSLLHVTSLEQRYEPSTRNPIGVELGVWNRYKHLQLILSDEAWNKESKL